MKKQAKSLYLSWKTNICMFLRLVMCFGVISCDGDDESIEPSRQNVPKRKKLVSIFTNGNFEYPSIEYDAYGRLSRIEEIYKPFGDNYISDIYYYDFTYIGNTLKVFMRRSDNTQKIQLTYLLNAQGCVSKPLSYSYSDFCNDDYDADDVTNMQYLFQYNSDGYLTAFNGAEDKSRKYVFSNDNLIRTILDNKSSTYLYTGDENKANIMIDDSMYSSTPMEDFTFDSIIRNGITTILYNAGLLGKASKNLVSRNMLYGESRFTYAFDSDGYPNYIEIDSYSSDGRSFWSRQFFLAYK